MAKNTKDAYERPVRQERIPPPAYIKPFNAIKSSVTIGERMRITERVMLYNPSHWGTNELEGIIYELAPNALILNGNRVIPYYVILDWELVE